LLHYTLLPHLQCALRLASRSRSGGADHGPRIPALTPQPLPQGEGSVESVMDCHPLRKTQKWGRTISLVHSACGHAPVGTRLPVTEVAKTLNRAGRLYSPLSLGFHFPPHE